MANDDDDTMGWCLRPSLFALGLMYSQVTAAGVMYHTRTGGNCALKPIIHRCDVSVTFLWFIKS
jgi:hypothetical protein